jgi:hypothetical protein
MKQCRRKAFPLSESSRRKLRLNQNQLWQGLAAQTQYSSTYIMSESLLNSRQRGSPWAPKYPFDLLVAYDDVTTRNRALQLCDRLTKKLADDYDFKCTWWKFDHLRDTTLREQAADAAAEANMIILSIHADKELPVAVKAWTETWLARKDHGKRALVTLIDGAQQQGQGFCPVQLYLQKVAHIGGMNFFSQPFDLPIETPRYTAETIKERAVKVTPVLVQILNQRAAIPMWKFGINE